MIAFTEIRGRFFRAVPESRLDQPLAAPSPESAGRYHRPGQPALYMSPQIEWARIAVSGYMREDGLPRSIVPLTVCGALVLDQRNAEACSAAGIDRDSSNLPWRKPLADGATPPSWANSDIARSLPCDGIIDRSRHIRDGWHLILFRWNEPGSPQVEVAGDPVDVEIKTTGPKWS
ncbi:MAG: RES family NAD+ phosphorylase [Paracoccaceae bacterium]